MSKQPKIVWLEIADPPELWRKIGYEVNDAGSCWVGGIEHRLVGTAGPKRGLIGWALSGVDPEVRSIDGIATTVVTSQDQKDTARTGHPNRVESIDHLVIRTSSTPRTAAALESIGLERRGHSETTSSGDAVDMTFFWIGGTLLEIVGPPEPSGKSKPARFMGIAYVSDDLNSTAGYLGELCSDPKDAVQPGRQIAALRSSAGSSMPMAFMTPHVKTHT